jgi:ATP synthase protein I
MGMSQEPDPRSLDELESRLRKARERGAGPEKPERSDDLPGGSLGFAFRIGVELLAAMIVGVGGGLLLDRWLGTAPWGLIGMFFLGAGAGVMNVYRAVSGIGYAAGYDRQAGGSDGGPPDKKSH